MILCTTDINQYTNTYTLVSIIILRCIFINYSDITKTGKSAKYLIYIINNSHFSPIIVLQNVSEQQENQNKPLLYNHILTALLFRLPVQEEIQQTISELSA